MKLQVGVKALIKNSKDQYLLLHRAGAMANEKEAHWDIPGGRIDPAEPLLAALQREIIEETGLTLNDEPTLLIAQDIFVPTADLHVVRLTYLMQGDGTAVISHEHQDTRWVALHEALALNIDPYLREALDKQKAPR
jgi:8-oxo-dGTP diphosphatase